MKTLAKQYGHKLIALLLLLCFIIHWRIFPGFFHSDPLYKLVVATWFILSSGSAIGLWLNKRWGFWFFYPYLIYTPVALGMSVVPLITHLFPFAARAWVVLTINLAFFGFTIWLHRQQQSSIENDN